MEKTIIGQGYQQAMAASFANQVDEIIIPHNQLDERVELSLGFQPLGIASKGDQIAITDYFMPAICLAKVFQDEEGLHFKVSWIRAVDYEGVSVRIFPDVFDWTGANRAQTVNFGPDGTLWVTRNGDRKIFVLSPVDATTGRAKLLHSFALPGEELMVHSASLAGGMLATIESAREPGQNWLFNLYDVENIERCCRLTTEVVPPWTYGIGRNDNFSYWFVTDARHNEEQGIFKDKHLIVPQLYGNGLCFLSDGSALVTKYGLAGPSAFGEPGGLIYVPSSLL